MKIRHAILAAVAAAAVAVSAMVAQAGPPTAEAWNVRVPADAAWVDTGVDVTGGYGYLVTAEGTAFTFMPNGLAAPTSGFGRGGDSGPEGQIYQSVAGGLMNGVGYGTLVGRIGSGPAFSVGAGPGFQRPESGRLYLAVNDFDHPESWADNSGGYTVEIRQPSWLR